MNWGFSHGVFIYDHVRMIKQGLTHGSTPQQYDSGMTNHQRPAMSSLQLASPLQQDLEIIFQSRSLHRVFAKNCHVRSTGNHSPNFQPWGYENNHPKNQSIPNFKQHESIGWGVWPFSLLPRTNFPHSKHVFSTGSVHKLRGPSWRVSTIWCSVHLLILA